MGEIVEIKLQRFDTTQPWGFKMQGGSEYNLPLHVAQVSYLKLFSLLCG